MNDYCGCSSGASRGFLTKSEKIEMLKEYQEQLDLESKGVSERIKDLQKAGWKIDPLLLVPQSQEANPEDFNSTPTHHSRAPFI